MEATNPSPIIQKMCMCTLSRHSQRHLRIHDDADVDLDVAHDTQSFGIDLALLGPAYFGGRSAPYIVLYNDGSAVELEQMVDSEVLTTYRIAIA